jgi:hypothetical protein
MLAHEHGGVRVVQEIAREVRQLGEHLLRDFRMPVGRDEDAETR